MFSDRVVLVDVLAALFGISSWIAINGVWVQTPLLVAKLTEAWNLASYIVVMVELANVGPVIYSLVKMKLPLKTIERLAIHTILAIGAIASLALIFVWDRTTEVGGKQQSVPFLSMVTLLALVDCTTSVLYLPFMTYYKTKYLMTFLVGEGLSGLVPSILALIQGVGGNPSCVNTTASGNHTVPKYPAPNYSVSTFFVLLLVLVLLSWLAFILLIYLKQCKMEMVVHQELDDQELEPNEQAQNPNPDDLSQTTYYVLLITQAYICSLTNGILPSVQSYSCLPYGNLSYHFAVTLSSMANPLSCFVVFSLRSDLIKKCLPVTVPLGTLFAAYIMATAVLSPSPPLRDSDSGKALIIFVWISMSALFSYSKASIAVLLRNRSTGHKSLFACGVVTQVGSAAGAVVMFFIVNKTKIFHTYYSCK